MARRPRIEIAGYYHIVNRGVAQQAILREPSDYEYFEELMCFYMQSYGITLHNYCLMGNHYHLLIETAQENLSKFMRQLGMNYAIYFNKKYKRVGHLSYIAMSNIQGGLSLGSSRMKLISIH